MHGLFRSFASAAFVTLLSVTAVSAADVKAGDLVVSQAWSRATPGGAKVAGGFLTITNKGAADDRLVAITAEVAGATEVHEMSMDNGVMKMRPVEGGLPVPAGKTVTLAPGGYHLMLEELKAPLKQGEQVPVTLQFEKAGKVLVTLDVQGVGAKGPGDAGGGMTRMDHGTMDHGKMDHSGHGMSK